MYKLLENIDSPDNLKNLNLISLNELAAEIRSLLIDSVSRCGGHLASNLGVVELTIALHYVFNSPQDKLIWDVGHQSYVHKALTGRYREMDNLRQFGGLSGFPRCDESPHDAFNTGHSSTSISAAMGMALARDIQGEKHSVVAVIGDGALTGGMAFEALNHAGNLDRDLIVVLNDNEMSISRNVGAMSAYLNRLRTDPSYSRRKEGIESALNRIPAIGPNLARAAGKFKDTVKYMMVPGILFEELGFTYIGLVDGHNLEELITVLSNVKKMKGPVLVHAITQKGQGYMPALEDPDRFHGIGPFDKKTGTSKPKSIKTYTEVFGDFMLQQGEKDDKLVAITAAMTTGTGLSDFAEAYPERFFDVGICEQHAVTMAGGMAREGLHPVVAIYSTFLQRAYDQIIHDVALQNLPVIFAVDRAGLVGEDGPTHHGVFDLSFLRTIPNLTVMAPSNENELLAMLNTAFTIKGPVAIRYPRGVGEGLTTDPEAEILPLGKAVLSEPGSKMALIGIGRGFNIARQVRELLTEKGIDAALIDARFVKPLDEAMMLELAQKCGRLVTIEDNCLTGGFGAAVLESLARHGNKAEVISYGIPDDFVEHGKVELLLDLLDLDPESIVESMVDRWPDLVQPEGSWRVLRFGKK
ncbi:MAG: 1-deoxy-D-xylulose-5-phosphate synthase [Deltaproteobacteria bacterium]